MHIKIVYFMSKETSKLHMQKIWTKAPIKNLIDLKGGYLSLEQIGNWALTKYEIIVCYKNVWTFSFKYFELVTIVLQLWRKIYSLSFFRSNYNVWKSQGFLLLTLSDYNAKKSLTPIRSMSALGWKYFYTYKILRNLMFEFR